MRRGFRGKPFIRRRAAIDIDLAFFGQGKANVHLLKAAAAVTFAGAGYAHAAGSDAVEHLFQLGDLRLDRVSNALAFIQSFEENLHGSLHDGDVSFSSSSSSIFLPLWTVAGNAE